MENTQSSHQWLNNLNQAYQCVMVLCHDIAKAIGHLHGLGFIHRDLKAANLLLNAIPINLSSNLAHIKLIDFGSSAKIDEKDPENFVQPFVETSNVGSMFWMACELFLGKKHSKKTGTW